MNEKQKRQLTKRRQAALLKVQERRMRKYETDSLGKNPAKRFEPEGPSLGARDLGGRRRARFVPKKDV